MANSCFRFNRLVDEGVKFSIPGQGLSGRYSVPGTAGSVGVGMPGRLDLFQRMAIPQVDSCSVGDGQLEQDAGCPLLRVGQIPNVVHFVDQVCSCQDLRVLLLVFWFVAVPTDISCVLTESPSISCIRPGQYASPGASTGCIAE